MDSIHVPARVVHRIVAAAKFVMPILATAITAAGAVGWGWISTRTSVAEVAPLIAAVSTAAKSAQSTALTCETDTKIVKALAVELARTQIEMWGQSEVDRAYSKSPRRAEYIERSRRFYLASFEDHLDRNPNDIAAALRRARQAVWRPDRDD